MIKTLLFTFLIMLVAGCVVGDYLGLQGCFGGSMSKDVKGMRLPTLVLPNSAGGDLRIPEDLLGSYTVLYFYPKNQTPGCTKEACSFRDNEADFREVGAKVYGISSDSIDSHHKFISKHNLNFPLLSDRKLELAKALGVSSLLGMPSRDTFLIDPEGTVIEVWRKVDATKTVFETLQVLKKRTTAQ